MPLSFTFDDGYASWPEAANILTQHNARGTFCVCLRNVVKWRHPGRTRMFPATEVITWDELRAMQAQGHEIASHGMLHPDLGEASDLELEVELNLSFRLLVEHGLHITTFSMPFNRCPPAVIEKARCWYKAIRSNIGPNPYPFTGHVCRGLHPPHAVQLARPNVWAVAVYHDPDPKPFERTVSRMAADGVPILSIREAMA